MFVAENIDLIADELGIDVAELEQLSYDEGEHTSSDGLIYYYYITFHDGNPRDIMAKIARLQGNMVTFEPSLFLSEDAPD